MQIALNINEFSIFLIAVLFISGITVIILL